MNEQDQAQRPGAMRYVPARREVLVLAESGEDDPKRAQASAAPGWHGLLALGTTRRVVVPLLEHLDATRRTRRDRDGNRVVTASESVGSNA